MSAIERSPSVQHRPGCVRGSGAHAAECPCTCTCETAGIEYRVEHRSHDEHPQTTAEWLAHHGSPDEAEMRRVMARWQGEYPTCEYRLVRVTTIREVLDDEEPCDECGAAPGDACEDDGGTPCPRYSS